MSGKHRLVKADVVEREIRPPLQAFLIDLQIMLRAISVLVTMGNEKPWSGAHGKLDESPSIIPAAKLVPAYSKLGAGMAKLAPDLVGGMTFMVQCDLLVVKSSGISPTTLTSGK